MRRYMSIIIALTDIGPGDGATVLVPGSKRMPLFHSLAVLQTLLSYQHCESCVGHKSMIKHPAQQQMVTEGSLVEGAEEMYLRAGDALLFNDSLCQ
jgi:ectoine hydroxylase-related dioxygenase (phytanoyl-CoA dioxygenase family)